MSGSGRIQKVTGPLKPFAAGFAQFLAGRGYSPGPVRLRLWLVDHVSRWLEAGELEPRALTPVVVRSAQAEPPADHHAAPQS
jgi:hypothetical protein